MKKTRRTKITTEQIIVMFKEVHKEKFDYSLVEYKTMHHKVKIICSVHGVFEQTPNAHIRQKQECKKCTTIEFHKKQIDTTESFIQKAKTIHGETYDYSIVKYGNNAHDKVKIICKKHGIFSISPNSHLSKKCGCIECGRESIGWTKTAWINACRGKKGSLYIIECHNDTERFFKIGITTRKTLKERFYHKNLMPYDYEVIMFKSFDNPLISWELERKLHKLNKENKYIPLLFFDGFTECFNKINKKLKMITKTQYHYTCLTKQGFTKSFILLCTSEGNTLYEHSLGKTVKSIEEAETYLCTEFTDVLLVSKTEIITVKIEKPIYFQTSVMGDTEKWCKCSGTYSNSEDIICPKCNNPIP